MLRTVRNVSITRNLPATLQIYYLVNFSGDTVPGEFVNVELGFDETQYSLLASFGFTALFAVSSLLAGPVVDSSNRARLAVVSCSIWSLATMATGLASSFDGVLLFRVLQGISQGFTNPAAYGLLADLFPPERRATANSLYSSGIYLGGGLASLSILLVSSSGWRSACFAVGSAGLVAATISLFMVRDPAWEELTNPEASEVMKSARLEPVARGEDGPMPPLRAIGSILETEPVAWLFLASALRFCAGFGIGVWVAPFFRETFPDCQSSFAVANAFVVGLGGFISSITGGSLSDRFSRRTPNGGVVDPGARAWLMALSSFLAIPAWTAVMMAPSFNIAIAFLLIEYLVAECWFGPAVAVLQDNVPATQRGTAQGLFSVLTTVGNISPVLIGAALSAHYDLQFILLRVIPAFYGSAGLAFLGTGLALRRAASDESS